MRWSSWEDFRCLRNYSTLSGTYCWGTKGVGGAGKEEGGRDGWTFLEHRRDKPTLRGQRVEWLRAGHQSQAIGSKSGSVLSVLWTWALLSHSEPVSSAVKYELRRLNEQARIKSLELNLARSTCSLMLVVVNIIIIFT